MLRPYGFFIGLRYAFVRRGNPLMPLALLSTGGMVLGMSALIVVLAVMNGFEQVIVRDLLRLVPHGRITGEAGYLEDWRSSAAWLRGQPGVRAVSPYLGARGVLSSDYGMSAVELRGILPEEEKELLARYMLVGTPEELRGGEFGMILGSRQATALGLQPGDSAALILPVRMVTPAGVFPRLRRFHVRGLFESSGDFDDSYVYIHMEDAALMLRQKAGVSGVQLWFEKYRRAPLLVAQLLSRQPTWRGEDWSRQHGSLFRALRMERITVSVLLLLIIAVAAFSILAVLSMGVVRRRRDVAVLRVLGASPAALGGVFLVQGAALGGLGIALGVLIGVPLALHIGALVSWVEQLVGVHLLSAELAMLDSLPSLVRPGEVLFMSACALLLSLLAALAPALRASTLVPAEVLRYE